MLDKVSRLFGFTISDLKALAYQLAKKINKLNPFSAAKGRTGKDWFLGFMKLHPEFAIRKPESISAARSSGFNKVAVNILFNQLGGRIKLDHYLRQKKKLRTTN